MMKIKVVIISITIIFISVLSGVHIFKHKSMTTAASNADLTFAVLGDIHGNTKNFETAIKDLHKINSNMNAIVLNGDTVDQGLDKQYDSVKNVVNKNRNLLPKEIIKNMGNHEFFDYSKGTNSPEQVQGFLNKYLEFAGEEKVYHDTWVKGYHFISLGSEDGNSETTDMITAFVSNEQLKWFEEKLAESYEKEKPIFVFLHEPLDYGMRDGRGVKQSEQVRQILSKYPEAILFSSHMHRDINESSAALDQPFTTIQTGAIDYTLIPDANSEGGRRREAYIKGLYVEVKGNKVVVKGRNIKDKQWIFTKEVAKG